MSELNEFILGKIARSRWTRNESLIVGRHIVFHTELIKRLYARFFDGFQMNFQQMMRMAHHQFPEERAQRVEDAIRQDIAACTQTVDEEIANLQRLFDRHAIASLIVYPDPPLALEVRMIVGISIHYLSLLERADHAIRLLDTLAACGAIDSREQRHRRSVIRHGVKSIPCKVRKWKNERDSIRTASQHACWPSEL